MEWMSYGQRIQKQPLFIKVLWLVLVSCGFSGCVRGVRMPTFPHRVELKHVSGQQNVQFLLYAHDQRTLPHIIEATRRALRRTNIWGPLQAPLTVRIFPTHRSLEQAVLRRYAWLRAWALHREIYLQSPRTWRVRYYTSALQELLVHELTHVVMYQLCCSAKNWRYRDIPFWFREGMASVTAHQERRRWSMERLALLGRTPQGASILRRPDRHLKTHQPVGYSLAHWMFVELIRQIRHEGVRTLLQGMREGQSFTYAFRKQLKVTPHVFHMRFLKVLRERSPFTLKLNSTKVHLKYCANSFYR